MSQTFLGFDYGHRRIGVAAGQTVTGTAEGIATILANYPTGPWLEIEKLIDAWQPDGLVVGMPVTSYKNESELVRQSRAFGNELCSRFHLPVHFIDETLTSNSADAIIRETTTPGKHITKRRKTIRDRLAAELILQTYLHEYHNVETG